MKIFFKRYRSFLLITILAIVIINISPIHGAAIKASFSNQILTMLAIIPPIFILLGLFDVWIPREIIISMLGEKSGIKGALLAFLLGSAAAGPLYGAFPVAGIMMKKGASLFNVLLFIGAWSTTKIPMFLFELNSLGFKFALSRLSISIIGITFISFILNKNITKSEKDSVYKKNSK